MVRYVPAGENFSLKLVDPPSQPGTLSSWPGETSWPSRTQVQLKWIVLNFDLYQEPNRQSPSFCYFVLKHLSNLSFPLSCFFGRRMEPNSSIILSFFFSFFLFHLILFQINMLTKIYIVSMAFPFSFSLPFLLDLVWKSWPPLSLFFLFLFGRKKSLN